MERANASNLGVDEIKSRLKTHLIDYDLMANGDYEAFVESRAKELTAEITNLCGVREHTQPEEVLSAATEQN